MPKFRLETLLQHRKHLEDILQRELAAALAALEAERAALARIENARDRCRMQYEHRLREGIAASDVLQHQKYFNALKRQFDTQKARLDDAEREHEKRRAALVEAVKKRKILEKLKQKAIVADIRRQLRRERFAMDEAAVQRHIRSR